MTDNTDRCILCQKELTYLDIVAHKKFVNRGAEEYLCIDCLAKRFDVTSSELRERLEHFRKQGCTLFDKS